MIYIASEGMGRWGSGIIMHLFKLTFGEAEFKNCDEAKIIARSMFFANEKEFYCDKKLPYFTWSGESREPPLRNYPPLFKLLTHDNNTGAFVIPYFISTFFEMETFLNIKFDLNDIRLETKKDRPYFLAYCASNPKPHRNNLFNLIKKLDTTNTSHGVGQCCATNGMRFVSKNEWRDNWLCYKDYTFTIAMENVYAKGYVTEKLLMAFMAGSIPIYWGDSEWVKKVFNEKAIIFVQDFESLEECAKYIVSCDVEKYQSEPIFVKPEYQNLFNNDPCEDYKKIIDILKSELGSTLNEST